MSSPLISASQLAAIQGTAKRMFTTAVRIERPVFGSDEMGDDDQPAVPTVIVSSVNGWLHSTVTPQADFDSAQIVTVNDYRLNLPLGTDIRPRDIVTVIASSTKYTVIDTTNDETWPAMLNVSLRLRE